jgi:hypothetical protein
VWDLVSVLLKDPEKLKVGIEAMVEAERAGMRSDPEQQAKAWLEKLSGWKRSAAATYDWPPKDT